MRTIITRRLLSVIICILLITTTAVLMFSCNSISNAENDTTINNTPSVDEYEEIGEGDNSFYLVVQPDNQDKIFYYIHTDEEYVGPALLELGLVSGVSSQYGLYIKTVCGITADYDVDGTYWAFYVDGEYSNYGVDSTEIKTDSVYTLQVSS